MIIRTLSILACAQLCIHADEAAVLNKLRGTVDKPQTVRVKRDRETGNIVELALNAPDLQNDDLRLFNQLPHLKRLTISHAGYAKGKKTGVDFSGVIHLRKHPSLDYFSAGGAVGKEYLAALAQLINITELYIQTTHSVDADWKPIGTMTHLRYLGIRVRNDRMSNLTEGMFVHLKPLKNLDHFLLSEMTFKDPQPLIDFVVTNRKLKKLTLRRCVNFPRDARDAIRRSHPDLQIEIRDR